MADDGPDRDVVMAASAGERLRHVDLTAPSSRVKSLCPDSGPMSVSAASVTMTPASYAGHIIAHKRVLTQVHSLFLYSHSPMGRQSDTTGERSSAGYTFLRDIRNTEAVI
ncbi:unnamed protein product [Chrysodeixis includens]|uniref:Uncharacterized protein n=1 Tax=Chrysodeixis includens TaxID=689277 RepID=A0A9N8L112_CHRIL|nr:unnamed protein product [Chrysodeixis includens]